MNNKLPRKQDQSLEATDGVESLYQQLLQAFYGKPNRVQAKEIAERLEAVLATRRDVSDSIRGDEVRAILAELRGDLEEAVRSRRREIRKIRQLHEMASGKPGWEYVLQQYDYSDLSDRLDLLAINYAEQGDLDRAVRVLRKSKKICETHHIPFGGKCLLSEYEQARRSAPKNSTHRTGL
jgi:hypothetical protein